MLDVLLLFTILIPSITSILVLLSTVKSLRKELIEAETAAEQYKQLAELRKNHGWITERPPTQDEVGDFTQCLVLTNSPTVEQAIVRYGESVRFAWGENFIGWQALPKRPEHTKPRYEDLLSPKKAALELQ